MFNEMAVPGLWADIRYHNSTGIIEDETLLGNATEMKLRLGYALGGIQDSPVSVTLSSSSYTSGNTRYTRTISLPTYGPVKKKTIFYGLFSQRTAVLKEEKGDELNPETEVSDSTTALVGAGVRWQSYGNITVDIDNYGLYQEDGLTGIDLEIMQGGDGAFKGLHWLLSVDSYSFPWYMRASVGSGLSGLNENLELIDTLVTQVAFGFTFSDAFTRETIDWDPDCWQKKRDLEGCKK